MQNKYLCYWNTEDFKKGGIEVKDISFFTENNGYEKEDIKAITNLSIGEVWEYPEYKKSHIVIRVTNNTEV